jgi:hypothetical protein
MAKRKNYGSTMEQHGDDAKDYLRLVRLEIKRLNVALQRDECGDALNKLRNASIYAGQYAISRRKSGRAVAVTSIVKGPFARFYRRCVK